MVHEEGENFTENRFEGFSNSLVQKGVTLFCLQGWPTGELIRLYLERSQLKHADKYFHRMNGKFNSNIQSFFFLKF